MSENGGTGFLDSGETFINKLKLLRLIVFHDDHSVFFAVLLSNDEYFLNILSFFDLDILDKVLPKGGLNFVEIVKDFLSFHTFGKRLLGNNPGNGGFWFLHFLQFGTQNFLYLLQSSCS